MKRMSEEKVFALELSDDELGLINGGSNSIEGNAVSIEYDCARLDHRDIYEGGFPNCAATVESKSYCWSNDACMEFQVVYRGMSSCDRAWR